MNINNRIRHLEREAHAKVHKYHKIEIVMGEWCDCNGDCEVCKTYDNKTSRQIINGEIIINVGENS